MMTLEDWKNIAAIAQASAAVAAACVGGAWAYMKFVYRREKEPRAEFDVHLDFVGLQGDRWLVEASAIVDNKGSVRHPVRKFELHLRYLLRDDPLTGGQETINFQPLFPHSIKQLLWQETFIDPQIRHRNSYIACIPGNATFVLVFAKFEYQDQKFTAQKLFKVPSDASQ
jgi:hypothetical protein